MNDEELEIEIERDGEVIDRVENTGSYVMGRKELGEWLHLRASFSKGTVKKRLRRAGRLVERMAPRSIDEGPEYRPPYRLRQLVDDAIYWLDSWTETQKAPPEEAAEDDQRVHVAWQRLQECFDALEPEKALGAVLDERERQDEKWGPIPARHADGLRLADWMLILQEETGELAEAILEAQFGVGSIGPIRKEAVQAAAVALAIVEFVDYRMRAAEAED